MLLQSILVGIWAGICGIEQFNGTESLHQPLVSGLVVGLILGDMQTGLIAGGVLQLAWLGLVPLAGAQPPNVVIGGIIGVSFAIIAKQDPQIAVGIAIPFAILAQVLITLLFTAYSPLMHVADKYAENCNTKGIDLINISGPIVLFIFNFLIVFFFIALGNESIAPFVSSLPEKLISGFRIAGGMMPAVGFAMLLNIMLKKEYTPFLITGFVLVAYMHLDLLAVTLLAVAIALYDFYNSKNTTTVVKEDYSDGI